MDYRDVLLKVYNEAIADIDFSSKLNTTTINNIEILATNCLSQKAVYTVFTTLCIYKISHKEQDIRSHQTQIEGGFSGRSIDTLYITPTLKELDLPSMAESGWLTRSLEQPHPYTLDYEGKISNKSVKKAFLELIDDMQNKKTNPKYILVELLKIVIKVRKNSQIIIDPLTNPERLTISNLISTLEKQFSFKYSSFGGSKLPVLAFYAIYQLITKEITRYKDCTLKPLGSHTASDRTSKSAGDIEIFRDNQLFEAIEIKLDKAIDTNMIRIVKEKIERYNPARYYILSYCEIADNQKEDIEALINEVKNLHGCQIVANGLIATLKYYFRLIDNIEEFAAIYSNLIQDDNELKNIHKEKWNELLLELENEL